MRDPDGAREEAARSQLSGAPARGKRTRLICAPLLVRILPTAAPGCPRGACRNLQATPATPGKILQGLSGTPSRRCKALRKGVQEPARPSGRPFRRPSGPPGGPSGARQALREALPTPVRPSGRWVQEPARPSGRPFQHPSGPPGGHAGTGQALREAVAGSSHPRSEPLAAPRSTVRAGLRDPDRRSVMVTRATRPGSETACRRSAGAHPPAARPRAPAQAQAARPARSAPGPWTAPRSSLMPPARPAADRRRSCRRRRDRRRGGGGERAWRRRIPTASTESTANDINATAGRAERWERTREAGAAPHKDISHHYSSHAAQRGAVVSRLTWSGAQASSRQERENLTQGRKADAKARREREKRDGGSSDLRVFAFLLFCVFASPCAFALTLLLLQGAGGPG